MKKEENKKISTILRNNVNMQSGPQSKKSYLGCDTCKLKNGGLGKIKSFNRLNDSKNRPKKLQQELENKKTTIKLTDLCDEDKKRIVELIEELSKFVEKNQELKEQLDCIQQTTEEQKEYMKKQSKSHLEEKNFYINEINIYKKKLEKIENVLKNNKSQWENHERSLCTEISRLLKALQKSLEDKNKLNEELNNLKTCLKQSLKSFQKLRAEVSELQCQEQLIRKYKSTPCQTDMTLNPSSEKNLTEEESEEDEYLSTCNNQDIINPKSSLDIINYKLEHVCQLLKKNESSVKYNPQKFDIDLSILLKKGKLGNESPNENINHVTPSEQTKEEEDETTNGYMFLKLFDECSKTSTQAERILKKMENPLKIDGNKCADRVEKNKFSYSRPKESSSFDKFKSNIFLNKIVQKNNLFKTEKHQCDEDQLLDELFYSNKPVNFGLEPRLKTDDSEARKTDFDFPNS